MIKLEVKDLLFNGQKLIRYSAYTIVGITFIITLSIALFFQFVGSYAAPTAVYANTIISEGKLVSIPIQGLGIWSESLIGEISYPVPALLSAIFSLVTGFPRDLLLFTPLVAIYNIVYFVLAKKILCYNGDRNNYGLLLSAIFYSFVSFSNMTATFPYLGRATLGVVLLVYFVYLFIRLISEDKNSLYKRATLIPLILLTIVTGFTYYTSILAILFLSLSLMVIFGLYRFLKKPVLKKSYALPLLILSIMAGYIFTFNAYLGDISNYLGGNSLFSLFNSNVVNYVLQLFGMGSPSPLSGLVQMDLTTIILRNWTLRVLNVFIVIAIVTSLIKFRPSQKNSSNSRKLIWIYTLIVVILAISELPYLLLPNPVAPIRFLLLFGFLVLVSTLFIIMQKIRKSQLRLSLLLSFIALVILSMFGSLLYAVNYGYGAPAKPFGYYEVKPLAEFLCSNATNDSPIIITGDAGYTSTIFFYASLQNKTDTVIANPLNENTLILYSSLESGDMTPFFVKMNELGTDYLLIVNNTLPLYGDEWGYAVQIIDTSPLYAQMKLEYNDGKSQLFKIP